MMHRMLLLLVLSRQGDAWTYVPGQGNSGTSMIPGKAIQTDYASTEQDFKGSIVAVNLTSDLFTSASKAGQSLTMPGLATSSAGDSGLRTMVAPVLPHAGGHVPSQVLPLIDSLAGLSSNGTANQGDGALKHGKDERCVAMDQNYGTSESMCKAIKGEENCKVHTKPISSHVKEELVWESKKVACFWKTADSPPGECKTRDKSQYASSGYMKSWKKCAGILHTETCSNAKTDKGDPLCFWEKPGDEDAGKCMARDSTAYAADMVLNPASTRCPDLQLSKACATIKSESGASLCFWEKPGDNTEVGTCVGRRGETNWFASRLGVEVRPTTYAADGYTTAQDKCKGSQVSETCTETLSDEGDPLCCWKTKTEDCSACSGLRLPQLLYGACIVAMLIGQL